jgi:WRKY transcription factor 33
MAFVRVCAFQILASPTTGAIPAQRYDWKASADLIASQQDDSRGDFSFHTNSDAMAAQPASFPSFKVRTNASAHLAQPKLNKLLTV